MADCSWQCSLCTMVNATKAKYCNVCGRFKWEHIFEGKEKTEAEAPAGGVATGATSDPDTSSTPSPIALLAKIQNTDVQKEERSISKAFKELILDDKCPKPNPDVKIVEYPWSLELIYDRGRTLLMKISVRRNPKKAWRLLELAAKQGHPAAKWDLQLRKTDGDEIDWDKAVEFYVSKLQGTEMVDNVPTKEEEKALAAFCLGCCFLGGWGVERREDRAVSLYKMAVKRGYLKGLNEVGWIYDHGLGGVQRDSACAFKCFNILAKRGYALAQYNTGRCYRDGRGVQLDKKKAIKWLAKASLQGYHNAQRSLGQIYQTGFESVIVQDLVRAMELYRDSASNGDTAGVQKIQELLRNTRVMYTGTGVLKEPISYFAERKMKQIAETESKNTETPAGVPTNKINEQTLATDESAEQENVEEQGEEATKTPSASQPKNATVIGDYWVPSLYDRCCYVLASGIREHYLNANIPKAILDKIEHEAIQCSAGCGNVFYGKGRVTRTFVFMRLIKNEDERVATDKIISWRDFASVVRQAAWRDSNRHVLMQFCSSKCSVDFLHRNYYD
eukprot:TRINITY_DN4467_c0_g1_i2.p1 TRINITY_DN4467_c0_g1~~TRINITY_DN4467_c0_g1_i2.p1  ORF type:complete len:560 (+),score=111.47 TRINITY_DN4467_c0_g1_i2:95-1774(+)